MVDAMAPETADFVLNAGDTVEYPLGHQRQLGHRRSGLLRAPDDFGRYYTNVDRARLRPMDLDLLICAGAFVGIALGIWFAKSLSGWGWVFALIGVLLGGPPLFQWFRGTRGDG